MSFTKLISGTPGMINRAQAISGCHGVDEIMNAGSDEAIPSVVRSSPDSHAISVDTNAEIPILM